MDFNDQGPDATSSRAKTATAHQLSILTFRKMLSSAVQDLFGTAMGGGINIDILGFWTDQIKDPFNRMTTSISASPAVTKTATSPTSVAADTSIPSLPSSPSETATIVSTISTYSNMTAASAVLRCHSLDFNQLWNALTLFNALVDDRESRFEVRYVSSTLLGLQANSRQLKWPK
ncbi:hypothetical protein BC939DRAFT_151405 [Gamsiella multidivaricata]|uniref:uncharacterized protein n=1 Tax=Gamsiella multidivaricata TaxID=101098 RepID=UPI0022207B55|nr:uncharacterized protein BC939DRAFT_151405 [Gamsiella multidivaricata]KAI7824044.1 hypothetical protein BC939DRAFT_151405 [Gamsiella multidivaricata]